MSGHGGLILCIYELTFSDDSDDDPEDLSDEDPTDQVSRF